MSWNRREGAPYRARAALKQLDKHGIPLPAAVAEAVAVLDRIEAAPIPDPSPRAIHDAVLDGASLDELDAIALRQLTHSRVRDGWAQARLTAAIEVLSAIMAARDELHAQLAPLAEEHIEKLTKIAGLGEVRLDELIRNSRTDDARLLADKELIGTELHELFQFRDTFLTPVSLDTTPEGVDCSVWRNPRKVRNLHPTTVTDGFIAGIQRGGQLWYPSADEAAAAAAPIAAELRREADAKRRREHGVGHVAV